MLHVAVRLAIDGRTRVEADGRELRVSRVAAVSRLRQPDGRVCARLDGGRDVGGFEVILVGDGAH